MCAVSRRRHIGPSSPSSNLPPGYSHVPASDWSAAKGVLCGGKPITPNSMHKILRDKIYIGVIENKVSNNVARGEHQAIVSPDVFQQVQDALVANSNNTNHRRRSPNLLSRKLYNDKGVRFANQHACPKMWSWH